MGQSHQRKTDRAQESSAAKSPLRDPSKSSPSQEAPVGQARETQYVASGSAQDTMPKR